MCYQYRARACRGEHPAAARKSSVVKDSCRTSSHSLDSVVPVTHNEDAVRKAVTCAAVLSVLGAAINAPLHTHPDDHDTAHHPAHGMHAHWDGHQPLSPPPDAPEVGTTDSDRAVFFSVFVAVTAPGSPVLGSSPGGFELPVPAERPAHRGIAFAHGHDPPLLQSVSLRAPPALLS